MKRSIFVSFTIALFIQSLVFSSLCYPHSSRSPTIVFEPNNAIMAYGSPGGSTIITTVLGIGFNRMDCGMSLADAIAAPRISQGNGGVTQVDRGLEQTDLGKGSGSEGDWGINRFYSKR